MPKIHYILFVEVVSRDGVATYSTSSEEDVLLDIGLLFLAICCEALRAGDELVGAVICCEGCVFLIPGHRCRSCMLDSGSPM